MAENYIGIIKDCVEKGQPVSAQLALDVLRSDPGDIPDILVSASRMTQRHFSGRISLCSIVNAKSGACTEDCSFCAQSACHGTDIKVYPLQKKEVILEAYRDAASLPISHFGVVTSGATVTDEDFVAICESVKTGIKAGVHWCASLGSMTYEQFKQLKEAGLSRFHHNVETAESYFERVCTTHSYSGRLETIRNAQRAGLEICCGGIFGLGESLEQRVEFAMTLQREGVHSIPLNFLVPVKGTAMGGVLPMRPLEIIRAVAMVRLINPSAEIKVCAGRVHLRDLQSMIFYAGATGMMVGNLLTIAGRAVKDDLQMLDDLEVDYEWRNVD